MATEFEIPEVEGALRFDIPDSVGLPKVSIAIVDPDRRFTIRTAIFNNAPEYIP